MSADELDKLKAFIEKAQGTDNVQDTDKAEEE